MSSGKRKFRIELEDAEGSKYNLSLEGNVSKEKIMRIVEFMDLLNLESSGDKEVETTIGTSGSVGERIWKLVESEFPYSGFSSNDILELYEDHYNEPIKLSIISTYLSRYSDRGRLTRIRQGKGWIYRMSRLQEAQPSPPTSPDLPP